MFWYPIVALLFSSYSGFSRLFAFALEFPRPKQMSYKVIVGHVPFSVLAKLAAWDDVVINVPL
jgi:hypothetical protein